MDHSAHHGHYQHEDKAHVSGGVAADRHEGHHAEDFLKKFWVTLALTIPIVLYSDLPDTFFSLTAPVFPGSAYLPLFLGSIIFFYGGWVFIKGALRELQARLPGMMTLIALAITAAYLYSAGAVLFGNGMTLFWELSTLIAVMLIGHWIEMKAVQSAKGALRELAKLLPDTAEVMRDGKLATVALSELREGDNVLVRPGGKVPADGIVIEGESEVDESLITGESRPVLKKKGAEVIAGATNGDGSLQIRLLKLGEHTFLAGVMRLVAEAERSKSRLQLLSDKAAFYLTVLAVVAGAITFVAWLAVGESFGFSVERLVAVLVIACPHALGLAIPLVASISTTMASKNGFFVKRRLALEAARNITTVLFDKTGTLTKGSFGVVSVVGAEETLQLAAAADLKSEHPLARAIVAHAQEHNIKIPAVSSFKNTRGMGVAVEVNGRRVFVGSSRLLEEQGATISAEIEKLIRAHERDGKTVIHVVREKEWVGAVALADVIREESREAVRALRAMGIKVAMITGDAEDVAAWVSKELSIDEYFAHVLPGQKADAVKDLQARGERVAMVGDGVNDAPALTQADLGIAIGAGTNVAIESAGIILVKNDPGDIPKIIKLSRLTYSKMIQNLFWASGYNIIALPIAAGALAVYGIMLQPAVAAVFMSLSTVIVAVNASLLRSTNI
ncbi:MAG: putative copper-exporting P-type ATPase B [Parcubacteria group bacterium Gr01-1014_8]|nr:MAG: putative copper-exporting P-type ATPase B [Parcubacteria group bacterium Gr01-1014_8]